MPPQRRLPTPAGPAGQVIRTRANTRALAKLRDSHRDEFDLLYQQELVRAREEAETHTGLVPAEHVGEQPPAKAAGQSGPKFAEHPPVPPRLLNGGATASGPRLRDDVARCPYCVAYHDRGHMCRACGHRPPRPRENPVIQVLKR